MLALTFQVGRDRVAVDVRRVREVVPRVHLQKSTGAPPWLAGMFVHRGRIVPVIDLHRLTDSGDCPPHLSSRILLVPFPGSTDGSLLGLLGTQVAEIRELKLGAAIPLNMAAGGKPNLGPVVSEGAGVLHLLDPDHLLPAAALSVLAAVPAAGVP